MPATGIDHEPIFAPRYWIIPAHLVFGHATVQRTPIADLQVIPVVVYRPPICRHGHPQVANLDFYPGQRLMEVDLARANVLPAKPDVALLVIHTRLDRSGPGQCSALSGAGPDFRVENNKAGLPCTSAARLSKKSMEPNLKSSEVSPARPVAFRPTLTDGLAFRLIFLLPQNGIK